jgi:hypothetical protein
MAPSFLSAFSLSNPGNYYADLYDEFSLPKTIKPLVGTIIYKVPLIPIHPKNPPYFPTLQVKIPYRVISIR